MKKNLMSPPTQETCLETLGERWVSGPSGVPEHPSPAPEEGGPPWAISVGRTGMEVIRAEEETLSFAPWPSNCASGPASNLFHEGIYGGKFPPTLD